MRKAKCAHLYTPLARNTDMLPRRGWRVPYGLQQTAQTSCIFISRHQRPNVDGQAPETGVGRILPIVIRRVDVRPPATAGEGCRKYLDHQGQRVTFRSEE